jgi:hypothetical protein
MRVAESGKGVISGMSGSRSSASAVAIASGTWTDGASVNSYAGGSITSIPAASSGKQRYDAIVLDTSTGLVSRIAGSENTPTVSSDFLENLQPLPPELASSYQVLICVVKVTSSGIPTGYNGHYATNGVAGTIIEVLAPVSGAAIHAAPSKTNPVDADLVGLADSAASYALKNLTWSNLKATIKTYFDALYAPLTHASRHQTGGADAIKLDDLATPDDNTDLDCSTSKHGLMEKLPGTVQAFLGNGSWLTRVWDADIIFGDGSAVLEGQRATFRSPGACKITAIYIRELARISSSATFTLYIHAISADIGTAVDTFTISSVTYGSESGLSIAVSAGQMVTVVLSGISNAKQLLFSIAFEAT